jgi:hypothetical protein
VPKEDKKKHLGVYRKYKLVDYLLCKPLAIGIPGFQDSRGQTQEEEDQQDRLFETGSGDVLMEIEEVQDWRQG